MSGGAEGFGTPAGFASYIGGQYGLDASVNGEGESVITATPATVQHVGELIAERGYAVEIEDDTEPGRLVVKPTPEDLEAVGKALDCGIPEPGEDLNVRDPVDRETDGGEVEAGGDEETPEPRRFTSRVVEVEEVPKQSVVPEYQVHVGRRTLSANEVRVGGLRVMMPECGSVAFEADKDASMRVEWSVEEVEGGDTARVVEVVPPADQ